MSVTINVALRRNGVQPPKHIFRTAKDSIQTQAEAIALARRLADIFPKWEYEITVWRSSTVKENLEWEERYCK